MIVDLFPGARRGGAHNWGKTSRSWLLRTQEQRLQTPGEQAGPFECSILRDMLELRALAVLMAFTDLADR
jgi:hypothetical protein